MRGFLALLLLVCLSAQGHTNVVTGAATRPFSSLQSIGFRLNNCDDCATVMSMPFFGRLGSRAFSSVVVSSNGVICVDCATTPAATSAFGALTSGLIGPNSSNASRISVFHSDLAPNLGGSVWFHCASSSCTASYEDVVVKENMGTINAQVEYFASGAIEFRYGPCRLPTSVNFTAGLQDESQNLRLPAPMPMCTSLGLCTSSSTSPANSGLRFSFLDIVNSSTVASLAQSVNVEQSRAVAFATAANLSITLAQASLANEASTSRLVERSLATSIGRESSRAVMSESQTLLQLSSEVARATLVEGSLQQSIDDEVNRAMLAETIERERAEESEMTIQQNIDFVRIEVTQLNTSLLSEVSRSSFATATETSRAMRVEASLTANISTMAAMWAANTTTLLATYSSLLSTNAADTSRFSTAIAALGLNASSAQSALRSLITASNNTLGEAINTIATNLANEVSRGEAARLGNALTANATLSIMVAASDDNQLRTASLAESLRASNTTLFQNIAVAASQATADAAALSSAHAAEVVRAMTAEGSIATFASQQLQSEASRAQRQESSLAITVNANIDLLASRAAAGENVLQARLDTLTAIVQSNTTTLDSQIQAQSAALTSLGSFVSSQATQAASRASSIELAATATYMSLGVAASTGNHVLRATISLGTGQLSTALVAQLSALGMTRADDASRAMLSATQLSTAIKSNTESLQDALSTQISTLQAEKQRAMATESSLALASATGIAALDGRISRTADALAVQTMQASTTARSLSMAITSETERAQSSAAYLDAVWSSAERSLKSKQDNLTATLAAETSRAKSSTDSLSALLNQINTSRVATAASLAAAVDVEQSRATAAEVAINVSLGSAGTAARMQLSTAQATLLNQVAVTRSQAMDLFENETASLEARSSFAMVALHEDLRSTSQRHMQTESSLADRLNHLNTRVLSNAITHSAAIAVLKSQANKINGTLSERIALTATQMSTALQAVQADSRLSEAQLSSSIEATRMTLSAQVDTLGLNLGGEIERNAVSLADALSAARLEASSRAADLSILHSAARTAAEAAEQSLGSAIELADGLAASRATNVLSQLQNLANQQASDTVAFDNRLNVMSAAQATNAELQAQALQAATASITSSRVAVESAFSTAIDSTREAASAASADLSARTSQQMSALTELHASTASVLNDGLVAQQASLAEETSRALGQEASIQRNLDAAQVTWRTALTALNTSLSESDSRVTRAVAQLQQNITTETLRRMSVETSLATVVANNSLALNDSVSREAARAMQSEASIQVALSAAEVHRSTATFALAERASSLNMSQTALRLNISTAAEQTREVQVAFAASMAQEANRASATEASLASAIDAEVVRAVDAETSEQDRAAEAEASLAATLLLANTSAWTMLDMERVRASVAEASIVETISTHEAARLSSVADLQMSITALGNQTTLSVQQLMAALMAEASTAAQTEDLLGERIGDINVTALSTIGSIARASVEGLQLLNATLVAESVRAMQASDNVTEMINSWSNSSADSAARLVQQLQNETTRAQEQEAILATQLISSLAELTVNTNASLQSLQVALAATVEQTAMDTQNFSLALNRSEAQARDWRREADDLRMELDRFFGEQVDDSRQGWNVALAGATECATCSTIRSNICLRAGALASAGLDMMEKLVQTFAYRLYLLKTQPALFTYGGNLSMIDANGIASMVVSQTVGNSSCLTVAVRVKAPALSDPSADGNRRRNVGGQSNENSTLVDLLEAINVTLRMPEEQLVWQQVQVASDGAIVMPARATGKSEQEDSGMDTIAAVLIAWNVVLSVFGLLLLVVVWRRRRLQNEAAGAPGREQTRGPLLKRYDTLEYGDALSDAPTLVSVGRRATNRVKTIFLPEPEMGVTLPGESNTDQQQRGESKLRDVDMMFGVVTESSLSDEPAMSSFGKTVARPTQTAQSKLDREREEEERAAEKVVMVAAVAEPGLPEAAVAQKEIPRIPQVPSAAGDAVTERAGVMGHSSSLVEGETGIPLHASGGDQASTAARVEEAAVHVQQAPSDEGYIFVAEDSIRSVRTGAGVIYSLASSYRKPTSSAVVVHSEDEYDQVRLVAQVDGSMLGRPPSESVMAAEVALDSTSPHSQTEERSVATENGEVGESEGADVKPAIYTLPLNKSVRKAWGGSGSSPERVDMSSELNSGRAAADPVPAPVASTASSSVSAPPRATTSEEDDASHYAEPGSHYTEPASTTGAVELEEASLPGQALGHDFEDEYPPMYTAENYSELLGEVDQDSFGAVSSFRETDMSI